MGMHDRDWYWQRYDELHRACLARRYGVMRLVHRVLRWLRLG